MRIGDVVTVNYVATNELARTTIGQASYNVSPPTVGAYFTKINCFCFTEQTFKPGERREMPVVFFVDPKLVQDSEQDDLTTITLSYTMYPVRQSEPQRVGKWSVVRRAKLSGNNRRAPGGAAHRERRRLKMADAHATPHHDYHLVDPSPWPIVGSVAAFITAVGAITWMHHMFAAAPFIFGVGVIGILYTVHRLVARCHPRSHLPGQSYAGGADLPPLRHDAVHRLGGDVLRRLVLGLFQHRAVSRRRASGGARSVPRRSMAAEGDRDLRSVASAAAQHADPADLGHHGDVGASRAAGKRPQGPEVGTDPHHPARAHLHLVQGYEYSHAAFHYSGHIYGATFFMATGFMAPTSSSGRRS